MATKCVAVNCEVKDILDKALKPGRTQADQADGSDAGRQE
jgi:hypothetical protein